MKRGRRAKTRKEKPRFRRALQCRPHRLQTQTNSTRRATEQFRRGNMGRGRSAFVAACGLSSVAAFSPSAPTTTHLRAAGTSIARATAIQLQDKAEVRRAREQ